MNSQVTCAFTYEGTYYEQHGTGQQATYQRRKQNTDTWQLVKPTTFQNVGNLSSQQIRRWNRGDYF